MRLREVQQPAARRALILRGLILVPSDRARCDHEVVELAMELCRTATPPGGEGPVAEVVAGYLRNHGFEVDLQPVVEGRPNVVAIARGNDAYKSVMLNGHLDIAPPVGQWRHDPLQPWIEDAQLHGAGLHDMKGGLAALMVGGSVAAQTTARDRGDIVLTAVMHHGTSGLGLKYFLDSCDWRIDAGINGEPTDLSIQLFHGGAWGFEIVVEGVPRHQSRLEEGANAITAMARVVDAATVDCLTHVRNDGIPFLPRIVVGTIAGGEDNTMTAARCTATGDVRFLPGMTIEGMKGDLMRVVEAACATDARLHGRVSTIAYQRPYIMTPDAWIVGVMARAHETVGHSDVRLTSGLPAGSYVTDAVDMLRHGIPTVIYGPGSWRTEPNEAISVSDLGAAAAAYAVATGEICAERR